MGNLHRKSIQIWIGLGLLLVGVAIRLPHLNQSLWYDEMTTLVEYVAQPWGKILAAGPGEYVPNNHVLHTILAKMVYSTSGDGDATPPREALLRLPAFAAGLLVPFALAWPLRRREPLLCLMLALVAMLHPWLVAFSVEARGYSLLLLLGIIATNCLLTPVLRYSEEPDASGVQPGSSEYLRTGVGDLKPSLNRPISYAIFLALAIYTVPLAVLLIPAHAAVIFFLRRNQFRKWLIGVAGAVVLATLLYLPMVHGLISYYRNPYPPTMDYRQFLDWLPRYAMAGVRLPRSADPFAPPVTGAIFWALPTLAIVFGSVLGWSRISLRPMLITLGGATLGGMLLALVDPGATEVRFVPWVLLWFCVAVAAIFVSAPTRWGKAAAIVGFITLISWQVLQDMTMPPNQPIREGIQLADKIVPPDRDILVLYLGARESIALYGDTHHRLLPAPETISMVLAQQKSLRETAHLPWVIIFFEELARDRDLGPPETRAMWRSLMANYHLAGPRLPGRLTPIAIYAPNEKNVP